MTNQDALDLTRRRLLLGLGGVGTAAVTAGAGTSAYFSDSEGYADNSLVAGELDLMLDWQEHYVDGSADESADRTDDFGGDEAGEGFAVVRTDGDPDAVPDGHVGLPVPSAPQVAVPEAFLDDFMANTAVEAFPDSDDDGRQDLVLTRNQISTRYPRISPEQIESRYRSQFANLTAGLDAAARTGSARGDPLVRLTDVKPGDFGELTLSLHLFNNPGYIWLTGGLAKASESGHAEPEAVDADESGPADEASADLGDAEVELLDAVQVLLWHDDGDNLRGETEVVSSPHDVSMESSIQLSRSDAHIASGSLREVLGALSEGIPLDADASTPDRVCYPNSTTRHVCLAWWLPVDHANEIQTDSVAFDVGLYTEQCRHNDGSGP
ncbi:MAG: hypothetical protein ABEJ82_10200 [Haloplanus sp.]